jgi:hypothetical protein
MYLENILGGRKLVGRENCACSMHFAQKSEGRTRFKAFTYAGVDQFRECARFHRQVCPISECEPACFSSLRKSASSEPNLI